MNPNYQRTPQDIAHEYEAVWRTVNARKRRLPATAEGIAYAATMDAIGASIGCCLSAPGVLVATTDALLVAEAALIEARGQLKATLDEFLAMDTARAADAGPVAPQVVTVGDAPRSAIAIAGDARE
jgi:hypothetical protein